MFVGRRSKAIDSDGNTCYSLSQRSLLTWVVYKEELLSLQLADRDCDLWIPQIKAAETAPGELQFMTTLVVFLLSLTIKEYGPHTLFVNPCCLPRPGKSFSVQIADVIVIFLGLASVCIVRILEVASGPPQLKK
ncbi:hypothetical protein T265_05058 [Opisthorchis viverrini]|uniref:Uncharacterized protein n=1 Tax=Opisthorchis viverrini TaxID=6198 RepID=A0A074ZKY4_OPIVI|nr:hypothetical protein T265_05058 [Opisthorchis viverrini]KER28013.1 hypothetical protein T265_05058 [Opisthorchis viverrini]